MKQLILFIALFVALGYSQPIIKRDWSQVNNQTSFPDGTYFIAPRAASFSDGRYIIVYTIMKPGSSESIAVGQIFNADGSTAKAEFLLDSTLSPTLTLTAPNVVVFDDNTFLVVFISSESIIYARRFNTDGNPISASYSADQTAPVFYNPVDGVELVGFADKSYAIVYFAGSRMIYVARDASDAFMWSFDVYATEGFLANAIVGDRTTSYMAVVSGSSDIYFKQATPSFNSFVGFTLTPSIASLPTQPAIALVGDLITTLFTLGDSISFATVSTMGFNDLGTASVFAGTSTSNFSSPAIVGLNDTTAFIAYQYANITDNSLHLVYRSATYTFGGDLIALTPSPIQYSVAGNLNSIRFVPLLGGDLLVVAKNPVSGDIWQQILTFCGNGQLELNEECDGGLNCNANCRCTNGLVGFEGVCGLPNVVPVLDCVETSNNAFKLHFSFDNQDPVAQTLEYGYQNSFTPSDLATDRPKLFPTGSSSTYPLSPYIATVPSTVKQFNWVLGSYNLTVDLTNITAVQCPTSVGFVADVRTAGNLDDGFTFASNFAARYNISTDRLTFEVFQTGGSVPVILLKRGINDNRYDVILTVAPANETQAATELTPVEAVQSVISDYKKNSTNVDENLLQGYDPDSNIKDITPTPTGVEVRGNRYDSSNVTPPTAAPSTSTTPPSSSLSPSNVPMAVSISATVLPSMVLVVIFCYILS